MEYDELRLRIQPTGAGAYSVLASAQGAEATGAFRLPFTELELENFVLRAGRLRARRGGGSPALKEAKKIGAGLFDAVVTGPIRALYYEAATKAQVEGRGLRITLALSGSPELMDVPWEYLYDDPRFLSVSERTPVVRYLDLQRGQQRLTVAPPLRILAIVSSPTDWDTLDVGRERANLEEALGGLIEDGSVEVHWLEKPSLGALRRRLDTGEFHVLHYVGHGKYDEDNEEGVLVLEDRDGRGCGVGGYELGTVLNDHTSLRLAVLNACDGARTGRKDPFAGVAASLVQRDIPAVVAMQFPITDSAAIVFAEGFYSAIARGASVDAALAKARLSMFAERSDDIEWGTPVLFLRVADGHIFDLPPAPKQMPVPVRPGTPRVLPQPVAEPEPPASRSAAGRRVSTGPSAPSTVEPSAPDEPSAPPREEASAPPPARRGPADRKRLALAIAGAIIAAAAVVIVLITSGGGGQPMRSTPQLRVNLAKSWLAAFNSGDDAKAATYWGYPSSYTTADNPFTNYFAVPADASSYWTHKQGCRLIQQGDPIPTSTGAAIYVIANGDRPGSTHCTTDRPYTEVLTMNKGHIVKLVSYQGHQRP